jgi:nucleotide-binding universal stress UspA family protein
MLVDRILVPLDGSSTAEAVLPHVRRLLRRHDATLILVRAVTPPPVEHAAMVVQAMEDAAREYLEGMKARLERAGVDVQVDLGVGGPATVVVSAARRRKATMIALATHGSTGLKRLLLGSVAEELVRLSPVPVLAVRPFHSYELRPKGGEEFAPVRNLLLPVDDAALALTAIDDVAKLAELFDSRVILLKILLRKGGKAPSTEAVEKAREELRGLGKRLERRGVETLQLVEAGEAVKGILSATRFHEADLVALPTHGRRGLRRLFLGSVSEEVLRKSTVPLLILRAEHAKGKVRKGS